MLINNFMCGLKFRGKQETFVESMLFGQSSDMKAELQEPYKLKRCVVLRLLGERFACAAKQIPVLLKVTFGIWDDESVTTMHIVEEAEEYDDDDEDDDNCHQVVLQVRGQGK
jgi:hypothetical protein